LTGWRCGACQVAVDANALVREHVATMLADWLVNLPDRYDYETRLLPYLLNFLADSSHVSPGSPSSSRWW
jgi:hypothetical protein